MTLTLRDVAVLYEIGDGHDDLPLQTAEHLREWVRTDAQFRARVETLERLADVAGLPADDANRLQGVVELRAQLGVLLEAPSWKHPAEILDPEGELGLECEALLKLAEARGTGDERLPPVVAKLRQAVEQERRDRRTVRRFAAELLEQPPATAQRMLREVARAVEKARAGDRCGIE